MFQVDETKVYFRYDVADPETIQKALGIKLPRRYQNWPEDLRITYCMMCHQVPGREDAIKMAGVAVCSPSDNFEKEKGRKVALTEALKGYGKRKRKLYWDAYFKAK